MRTHVLALLAALLLLLGLGVGSAAAQAPTQAAEQVSGSEQSATSSANAAQVAPSNRNVDVRIFSSGNGGAVTQTNAADATALAGNENATGQSATQSGSGTQAASQAAGNEQHAGAEANGIQIKPSNDNIVVRIDSPGTDGPVEQTNGAGATALAGNGNETTQTAAQGQGDGGGSYCCKDGGGAQAAEQTAHNEQSAKAEANAEQVKPSNSNVSVRIDSPGNGGSVTQTNAALAGALAKNKNETTQSAEQEQGSSCKCGGDGVQAVDQKAKSDQSAYADANAKQIHPSNSNTVVRIGSPGSDGPVEQTNVALADAVAGNANSTDQSATQSQGGGGVQAADQSAYNDQKADADANAVQVKPSNDNTVVRIGSHGSSGSVTQTNAALAGALAKNGNETTQSVEQDQAGDSCKCHGGGVQAASQKADSEQDADAESNAIQIKPSNSNTAVDLGHGKKDCGCHENHGGGGDVSQKNIAGALGIALNANSTDQSVEQSQDGGCKCHGGEQAVLQEAYNDQDADADANAFQLYPSNDNTAVGGSGGGDVSQTNAALSGALAGNANETTQWVGQYGGGVQAVGQKAGSSQYADADSNAKQIAPYNGNDAVGGKGGGDVSQENIALGLSGALNSNSTYQAVEQSQDGGCKCGDGVQAVAQHAFNHQDADAEANAIQVKPSNDNTAVGGSGGGDVSQTNAALAGALAKNGNATTQWVGQYGGGVQAVGQKAGSSQKADADANAIQLKPYNGNTAVDLGHGKGKDKCGCGDDHKGGGDVSQKNIAAALGIAFNANSTDQSVEQVAGDSCKCHGGGVQAALQKAFNHQDADAEANAFQLGASNANSGGGGSVRQANLALALALSGNKNWTGQEVGQSQL